MVEKIKEFSYELILDIMEKASRFDKVKVTIDKVFTVEIDNRASLDLEAGELSIEEKKAVATVKKEENKAEEIKKNKDNEKRLNALKEISRIEELKLTNPDEYMELMENEEKYVDDKFKLEEGEEDNG